MDEDRVLPTTREPVRTCVGCRRRRAKRELVRLALPPEGPVTLDRRARVPGRGAYVCPAPGCVERAARRGGQAVRRTLRGGGEDEVLAALRQVPVPGPEEQTA